MTSFATLLWRLDRDVVAPGCMSPSTHDRRIYDQSRVDIAKVADAILAGSAWEPTPWHATQRAACGALKRASRL